MTTHIAQLTQWWEAAEKGIGKAGDVVIERDDSPNFGSPSYAVFTLGRDEHENLTYRRVLSRFPKPKPAWHNAVAVIAHTRDDHWRRAFVHQFHADGTPTELWADQDGGYPQDDLIDPVPLIEAKVTDEMVERYQAEETRWRLEGGPSHPSVARRLLTAALGIEDE